MLWHQMNQRRNIQKIVPLAHFKKEELKAKALALAVREKKLYLKVYWKDI